MKNRSLGLTALLFLLALSAQAQTLEFSAEAYTVGEGGGSGTLTVIKSRAAAGPVSVHYATTDPDTGSQFATGGTDYVSTEGDLIFAPNAGQDTAILNGKFVRTGVGLVEVYNLK